eukprot:COSAG04_NODE_2069_length_4871_cov_17.387794_3_plen_166_part_00
MSYENAVKEYEELPSRGYSIAHTRSVSENDLAKELSRQFAEVESDWRRGRHRDLPNIEQLDLKNDEKMALETFTPPRPRGYDAAPGPAAAAPSVRGTAAAAPAAASQPAASAAAAGGLGRSRDELMSMSMDKLMELCDAAQPPVDIGTRSEMVGGLLRHQVRRNL